MEGTHVSKSFVIIGLVLLACKLNREMQVLLSFIVDGGKSWNEHGKYVMVLWVGVGLFIYSFLFFVYQALFGLDG